MAIRRDRAVYSDRERQSVIELRPHFASRLSIAYQAFSFLHFLEAEFLKADRNDINETRCILWFKICQAIHGCLFLRIQLLGLRRSAKNETIATVAAKANLAVLQLSATRI